ncbi:SRPBCC family protein [Roseateles amylovorans]|uniref:SRPBCC family protein n=1 Tax=Roseateles amylovorans TaxID=2978473 RepID=A0ABY6B5A9_9BURK|nr:SRPBCC family protein [Roseateles amylovorans]UXH78440.1 SRPBCC family protein [Roseateles amylovorans]
MTHTVRFHRVLKAPPERVYRAFTTAQAMCKWLPPHGFTGEMHQMEVRVGGEWRMSFTNLSTQAVHSFGGQYLELEFGRFLRYSSRFDDPNLRGEMITTVQLRSVFCGTEMEVTQEGIPELIPPEACHLGWQESLLLLTQLVEPDIPNG